jgi:general secretion pathway protein G
VIHSGYKRRGFTIVELLIVIVVIGVLAAITIVAYSGIQNRTSDAAVQADLKNYGGIIARYKVDNGVAPSGGGTGAPAAGVLTFKVNRNSYATNKHNFVYCTNGQDFVITAASRSGNRYVYKSTGGVAPYAQDWGGVIDVCANEGYPNSYSYGYISSGTWYTWTL